MKKELTSSEIEEYADKIEIMFHDLELSSIFGILLHLLLFNIDKIHLASNRRIVLFTLFDYFFEALYRKKEKT